MADRRDSGYQVTGSTGISAWLPHYPQGYGIRQDVVKPDMVFRCVAGAESSSERG